MSTSLFLLPLLLLLSEVLLPLISEVLLPLISEVLLPVISEILFFCALRSPAYSVCAPLALGHDVHRSCS
jgi:hypothetical protein